MLKTFTTSASALFVALSVLAAAPAQAGYDYSSKHVQCFYKKMKLWDPYYEVYYYEYVLVCPGY